MTRADIINTLAKKIDAKSYLEIGVNNGINFNSINIPYKIGVDPDKNSKANTLMTSDEFFKENRGTFDIVFVDGLHEWKQCKKDIENSLEVLNEGGYIICHDMKPLTKEAQMVPRIRKVWNGDVWRSWVALRMTRKDLEMFVVDTDHGCGVIKKGSQELLTIDTLISFDNLVSNHYNWLNLVSIQKFKEICQAE
jgi:hypothetical protein